MKTTYSKLCTLLLLAAAPLRAQQPQQDPIGQNVFPPELIMQHQEDVGLTDEQRSYMKNEIHQAQLRFTDLQWKAQDEVEKMVALLKLERVDEQQALAQLDKVVNAEREIKRAQIALLVRIKNKLTPEQQARLREFKSQSNKR